MKLFSLISVFCAVISLVLIPERFDWLIFIDGILIGVALPILLISVLEKAINC